MVLDFGAFLRVLGLLRRVGILNRGKFVHIAMIKEDSDLITITQKIEEVNSIILTFRQKKISKKATKKKLSSFSIFRKKKLINLCLLNLKSNQRN